MLFVSGFLLQICGEIRSDANKLGNEMGIIVRCARVYCMARGHSFNNIFLAPLGIRMVEINVT